VFRGAFSVTGDTVVLTGQFQHGTAGRLFLTGAVAILFLFFVASVAGLTMVFAATLPLRDRLLAGAFLGALMATTAIAVFFSVQPLRQDDVRNVSLTIRQAFNSDTSNHGLPRAGAHPAAEHER
jgi:hypothetical protein